MKLCIQCYNLVLVSEGQEGTIAAILGLGIRYNGQIPPVLEDDEIYVPADAKERELCRHR